MDKVVIEVTGYGSEIVVGTIDETAYESWFENKDGTDNTLIGCLSVLFSREVIRED